METSTDARQVSKDAYIRTYEAKLSLKRAQLWSIKQKVQKAAAAGRIGVSEQLRNAERGADTALATAEAKLQQLGDASDDSWERLTFESNIAWEDLARSLKVIVGRFS